MDRSILIVDDHPAFRRTARLLLEAEGFDVLGEAADGGSAIEAAARLAPQIVLLDVQLPDIDGFEVAHRLTAHEGCPAVVMCSSRDRADFGALVDSCGAIGFIPKGELSGARLRELLS